MNSKLGAAVAQMGQRARQSARELRVLPTDTKNLCLLAMADEVEKRSPEIIEANQLDVDQARERGLAEAMVDRLLLDQSRIEKIAADMRGIAELPDPVGSLIEETTLPNGVRLARRRTPIGVIGIIYESRPNVTADAASLCFKTGNATLLRGGSEAIHSNVALAEALSAGGREAGMPEHSIQLLRDTDRAGVRLMAELDQSLDVIIPRGGHQLIETVVGLARMPVIKHYNGICHVFVDRAANLEMAEQISINAKCQRPSVCNAMETLLVHQEIAADFLPRHIARLRELGVEVRGDETVQALGSDVVPATADDWFAEYLDLRLAIRVVDNLDQAIEHIEQYGSSHTESIVTEDQATAQEFLDRVDSSSVFWNVSTRIADGAEYGLGAEIGISTDKLHARGPMGLVELTTYKWVGIGNGQLRE